MNSPEVSTLDLPPTALSLGDRLLKRQLELSLSKLFYAACIRLSPAETATWQNALFQCQWHIAAGGNTSTLMIQCPSLAIAWRILQHLNPIGDLLERLAIAKICICSPGEDTPLVVRVDELPIYCN